MVIGGYNGSSLLGEGVGCLGHGYIQNEYLFSPTLVQSLVEDGCYASQVFKSIITPLIFSCMSLTIIRLRFVRLRLEMHT